MMNRARQAAMRILPGFLFSERGMLVPHRSAANAVSRVGQTDTAAAPQIGAVFVRLETDRTHAVNGELLVAVLGIARHPDRPDDLAVGVADLHASAFGENLVAGRAEQVAHEDRLLLGAHLD